MCAIAVSGRCESTIATRSPGTAPAADRTLASLFELSLSSPKLTVRLMTRGRP